jgi:uncharacterized membrane protein HdeD (DUF308 family)
MGTSGGLSEFEQRVEQQFGLKRSVLLAVGVACLALGALAILLPVTLYRASIQFVGVLLLGSAAVKAGQLLLGRRSSAERRRGWPVIACQVAFDIGMGLLLLNHWRISVGVATSALGLLFLCEGLVLIYTALRSPTARSCGLLAASGLVTAGVGVVITARLVDDPLRWAGVFAGLKLLSFGAALTWIAWRALRSDSSLVYEAVVPTPEIGELYAVYFGTAFHLGVFIGDGEVVHYLNDNHVYKVTWERFLSGRVPEHWTYPDLAPLPAADVVRTALAEVGKTYPYSFLRFNCENFAVFCKSGGATYYSRYAQVASGLAGVTTRPVLGTVAELNTRLVEWLAFHFGGSAGKEISLTIRRLGATVTNWLVAPGGRPGAGLAEQERETSR